MPAPEPRPGILDIAPYVGGASKAPGAARIIKLSSNEGAFGPSPKAMAAFRATAETMHRYPDGHADALREALAAAHGLDPARIVCGAGSDDLLILLVRCYAGPGDEVLYNRHGFLIYPISAQSVGAKPVAAPERELTADVDALLAAVTPRTKVVMLANPNNPTGSYLSSQEIRRLHHGLPPEVLLVIDSAYAEYVVRNDYSAGAAMVTEFDNVVMTRTFSKIYGLASLRLGWAYCPPPVADVLNRVRGPFNVSTPALQAGLAALADQEFIESSRLHNETWRNWLAGELTGLGLHVEPSVANFLLVKLAANGKHGVDAAFDALAKDGILTRKVASYGLPQHLRITIGREDEMRFLVDRFKAFLAA
jgi:histidinol-phosphate aminotransferase